MSTNLQQVPYLREQRQFPNEDVHDLANQVDHAYIDIANKVNSRIIGLFALNSQMVTGETWYLQGGPQRQQTLRQVYTFTAAGSIAHGLNFSTITYFTRIFGAIYDGTNYYPLPYVDVTNVNNQVSVQITSTNIVITAGGGSPPSITKGLLVIEWISQY